MGSVRMTARVDGRVQGVGFRWFVRRVAVELGLAGHATNRPDGTVEVVAEGPRDRCEQLVDTLRGPATPGQVGYVAIGWTQSTGLRGFAVE
ncbi:MAG: acylphosphatase [Jiangellaceae bacterium]